MELNIKEWSQEQYLVPVKIILVYLVWKLFHHFALIPGTALNHFWIDFMSGMGHQYAIVASFILTIGGVKASASGINIDLIASHKQIWVQEHCLAIPVIVVFTGTVLLFRGTWRDKLTFVAIGLAGIIVINLVRLVLVSLAWIYLTPYFFYLHHSLIYVIATYGFIFYLIAKWMDRQMKKPAAEEV